MIAKTNRIGNRIAWAAGFLLFASCFIAASPAQSAKEKQRLEAMQERLTRQVRHELVMVPYHSVFDNLTFRIEGVDSVVLKGQVVKPSLKKLIKRQRVIVTKIQARQFLSHWG